MFKKKPFIMLFVGVFVIAIGFCIATGQRQESDNRLEPLRQSESNRNDAENPQNRKTEEAVSLLIVTDEEKQVFVEECRRLGRSYKDLFLQAEKTPSPYADDGQRLTQSAKDQIEAHLIALGCPLIDSDAVYPAYLANSAPMQIFWDKAENSPEGECAYWGITDRGGLYECRFAFADGTLICTHAAMEWDGEAELELSFLEKRQVYDWGRTGERDVLYRDLLLDRHWIAGKLLRLKAVEQSLYDLCREYILPVGYHNVNLFLVDWTKDDYGQLCFNDLLDSMYYVNNNAPLREADFPHFDRPYPHNAIPAELFEQSILPHFVISPEEFRERAMYNADSQSYPWQAVDASNVLYYPMVIPEVTAHRPLDENSFVLTVRVMCPDYQTDHVFTHEVSIRETKDGGWQYLGNRILARGAVEQPSAQARIEAQPSQTEDKNHE